MTKSGGCGNLSLRRNKSDRHRHSIPHKLTASLSRLLCHRDPLVQLGKRAIHDYAHTRD